MRETSFSHPGIMRPVHVTVCLLLLCACVRCEAYASGQTAQSSLAREDDETWLPPVPEEVLDSLARLYIATGSNVLLGNLAYQLVLMKAVGALLW